MRLGIGIDTGGTYTDAVIYDFESGSIVGTAKALTTKEDLTVGILGAIDGLLNTIYIRRYEKNSTLSFIGMICSISGIVLCILVDIFTYLVV